MVDGHGSDLDVAPGDRPAVLQLDAGRVPPGQVAGGFHRRPQRLHGLRVVQRNVGVKEAHEGAVVEVEVADEDRGAAVPTLVKAVEAGRRADRQQVLELAAHARCQAQREGGLAGGVLEAEVEEDAAAAMLDGELETGRIAQVQERQSSLGTHWKPPIICGAWRSAGGGRAGGSESYPATS